MSLNLAHNGNMTEGPMFSGYYLPQLYIAHNGNLKKSSPALYLLNMTWDRLVDYEHTS